MDRQAMRDDILTLENVSFSYGDAGWRLREVSLAVGTGEMVAVIGPNGSGKSTLLKLAAGVFRPHSGRVSLQGKNLHAFDRRSIARVLGYLPQDVHYTFDYTVEEVVAMGRFPHLSGLGFLGRKDLDVVERCLAATETLPFKGQPLSHLSGGERQRVYLASILAQEPHILLLDEPTAGLDIHHQARFFRLLRGLAREGMAVTVVTHDLNLASLYCSRLLLMSDGAAVREGMPAEIIRPDILSEIYGEPVAVERDPRSGLPIVLPLLNGV